MKRRGNLLNGTVRTATGLALASALGVSGPAMAIPKPHVSVPTAPAEKAPAKPKAPKAEKPAKA